MIHLIILTKSCNGVENEKEHINCIVLNTVYGEL